MVAFAATRPTRLLCTPTVSATQIAFAYANNIWVVERGGGQARRLTGFQGQTSSPRFVTNVDTGATQQVTDGLADAMYRVFDAGGKYLWFLASTDFGLRSQWLDTTSYDREENFGLYLAVLKKGETGKPPAGARPGSGRWHGGGAGGRGAGGSDRRREARASSAGHGADRLRRLLQLCP